MFYTDIFIRICAMLWGKTKVPPKRISLPTLQYMVRAAKREKLSRKVTDITIDFIPDPQKKRGSMNRA